MLLLAVALSAVTVVPPRPAQTRSTAECPQTTAHIAVDNGKALTPKKLNELPPANLYKAVFRRIGGCEVPVVVRYDVGRR